MDHFNYRDDILYAEDVAISAIAEQVGTPCYIYSKATLERHWHAFNDALGDYPHQICYAVKANSNLAILNLFAKLGSGFDVVSVGELERVLAAGGDPGKVVFSGVAKSEAEMARALDVGIQCFNVESERELERLSEVAQQKKIKAPVSIRINPDVDAQTHPYISTGLKDNKFGIDIHQASKIYQHQARYPYLDFIGVDCHIGSQLLQLSPFLEALDRLLVMIDDLLSQGFTIKHLDLGGGLGVTYQDEQPPHPTEFAAAVAEKMNGRDIPIFLEPGRAIAANAGILLTQIEYIKENLGKYFAIVDAGMNDLLRPALYQAWQAIIPVQARDDGIAEYFDVVGPVCETGDFLGKNRYLNVLEKDYLAVRGAGAYGFCMSSNYNTRPRAAEVMVDGNQYYVIRQRETLSELMANETLLP